MTGYYVVLRNTETGEISPRAHYPYDFRDGFWWKAGNFACDCNREWEFDRACGKDEDDLREDIACSLGRFRVHITNLKGRVLYTEFE